MKSLYIVDEQTTVRQMLVEIVSKSNYEVIGHCGNGLEAAKDILELDPDVVIMELKLPGLSGSELLRRVVRKNDHVRFLVFSDQSSPNVVSDVLKAGAHGFIEKKAELSEFKQGLEVVADGGSYYGSNISSIIRSVIVNKEKVEQPSEILTQRELEVLKLIAYGKSTKEIAQELGLSVKTIDNHRCSLMRKLDLHNAASITRYAVEKRLVDINFSD